MTETITDEGTVSFSRNLEKLRLLRDEWLRFDPDPPTDLLRAIASRFDPTIAARAIRDVGRAGRLQSYAPYLERFVELRGQSRQLTQSNFRRATIVSPEAEA